MSLPDFLIIGGKKCGTTALFSLLREHHDIYMPRKEVHFFAYEGRQPPRTGSVTEIESYRRLFDTAVGTAVKGEASPSYMPFRPGYAG